MLCTAPLGLIGYNDYDTLGDYVDVGVQAPVWATKNRGLDASMQFALDTARVHDIVTFASP